MGRPSFDLRLVPSFVAVAEELHFGRAAERLAIAQPALSRQITKLEEQLGAALLTRTSRAVELTPSGELLLAASRDIVARAERARVVVDEVPSGADSLTVHIGDGMSPFITRAVSIFAAAHPDVDLRVVSGSMTAASIAVVDGTADVGFDHLPGPPARLGARIVERPAMGLVCACDHALAGPGPLPWTDLNGWTLTLTPPGSHDGYRAFVLAAIKDQGVSSDLWVSAPPDPVEVQRLIAAEGRIVVGPEFLTQVSTVPISWRPLVPAMTMETVVLWDEQTAGPATHRFIRSVVATAQRSMRGIDALPDPTSGVGTPRRPEPPVPRSEPDPANSGAIAPSARPEPV